MMGSCCCKKKVKVVNKFPKDKKFECIRAVGKMILTYEEQFEAPRFEIKFDDFYKRTLRIQPDKLSHKEVIEKTRTISMDLFSSSSEIDTVFKKK